MSTLPWIIYTRVSTDDQAHRGLSLDAQLIACRGYCVARTWKILEEISDPGFSGSSLKRPGISKALSLVKDGKAAGIVVWRLDRLTRSLKDLIGIVEAFGEKSGIISVTESLDTTSPMGRFTLHLIGAISQWERETIGARIKSAMTHAKQGGYYTGGHHVPPGTVAIQEGNRKRLIPGPEADKVRLAWEWAKEGQSLWEIAGKLKAQGIRSRSKDGKEWSAGMVRNMLLSRWYVGTLIDAATQEAVRSVLSEKACPGRNGKTKAPGAKAMEASILAGLVRCPTCEGAMFQTTATGRHGGKFRYFRCSQSVKHKCLQKDLRCEPIETAAIAALKEAVNGEYPKIIREERARSAGMMANHLEEQKAHQAERDRLAKKLDALAVGEESGPGMAHALKVLGDKIVTLDLKIAELEGLISAGRVDSMQTEWTLAEIQRAVDCLDTLPKTEQANALRAIAQRVLVQEDTVTLDLYHPQMQNPQPEGQGFVQNPILVEERGRKTKTLCM